MDTCRLNRKDYIRKREESSGNIRKQAMLTQASIVSKKGQVSSTAVATYVA